MNLSFIKLDINIMDDTKIKIMRKMPDGSKLFELWIGILCLAMKSSRAGTLEIGIGIPFTDESLSDHLDIPLKTTRMGLQVFKKFNMIEVWEDGTIFISNFEKHQKLDKIEKSKEATRLRVAKFRQNQRISLDVTGTKLLRNTTDKEEETETDIDTALRYTPVVSDDDMQKLWITTWGANPKLPEIEITQLFIDKFGLDKTKKIFKDAVLNGFHKIKTLWECLDDNGNIRSKDQQQKEIPEINL